MDENAFLRFLKKSGKSQRSMQGSLECARRFENYLKAHGRSFAAARPEDLRAFAAERAALGQGVNFLAISEVYEFLEVDSPVRWEAHAMFAESTFAGFRLSECLGIDPAHVAALGRAGIVTAPQILAAGRTPAQRAALAEQAGVPLDCVLELVKLADLARVGGLKKIRGRLYYDGGFDTLDKLAASTSFEVRRRLDEFITLTKFAGIIPTPKEAENAVRMARHLPRMVEY